MPLPRSLEQVNTTVDDGLKDGTIQGETMIREHIKMSWRHAEHELYLVEGESERAVPQWMARLLLDDLSEDASSDLLQLEQDLERYAAYIETKVAQATDDVVARRAALVIAFAEPGSRRRRRKATDQLTAAALRHAEWSNRRVQVSRRISEIHAWVTIAGISSPEATRSAA